MGDDAGMLLSSHFEEALAYATAVHRRHWRKGTTIPYVSHLLGTCSLVLEDGGTEDEAIGALLHDAVEDRGAHLLAEIEESFGREVAAIVEGCSEVRNVTEGAPELPWRHRKERYLAHLEVAPPSVLRVSNADKVHNARAVLADHRQMGARVWERFNPEARSPEIQLWYLGALAEVFARRRTDSFLVTELQAAVQALCDLSET